MSRFSMSDNRGFSLIELIVIIAMIAIIAAVGTPAFLSMKAKSSVRADARDVYSTFKHAQSEAVKRSDNVCIEFNKPSTNEYRVFVDNGVDFSVTPHVTFPAKAGNSTWDNEEVIAVHKLNPGSSFFIKSSWDKAAFNSRGLPATAQGSVEVRSSVLSFELSLSNSGILRSQVVP